jgi:hypothetical protein
MFENECNIKDEIEKALVKYLESEYTEMELEKFKIAYPDTIKHNVYEVLMQLESEVQDLQFVLSSRIDFFLSNEEDFVNGE